MKIDFSSTYNITENDKVFIDTNILIFLFSPDFVSSHDYQVDRYSTIYKMLLENNCKLLGICVGMQALFEKSEEGSLEGLKLIEGEVIKFKFQDKKFKVRMGVGKTSRN